MQQAETEAVLEYAGISSYQSLNEEPDIMWFGIRSVFFWGTRADGMNIFEERICVFSGASIDDAFAKSEKEADAYAEFIGAICHPWQEAFYQDGDALIDGYEVWSEMFEFNGDLEAFFQSRYAKFDYQGDKSALPFRKAKKPKES